MSSTALWVKGLSSQGKIYLATSSLTVGSAATGALAVDKTRDSIWSGMNYAGSKVSSMFSILFAADLAGGGAVSSNDKSVNEIFSSAWEGLSFLVNSGATRSWKSITWLGSLIPDIKKNYKTAEGYTKSSYKFLKDNWEHLWKFLKLYFRYIDLEKLYKLLSEESKRKKLAEVFQESNKSTLEGMVKNLQSIVSKSGEIGFYAGKPFDKIVQSLFEGSSNLGKLATRLGYLEGYIKDRNSRDKAQVESLIKFFSSSDSEIKSFAWDWFKNTGTQR